MNDMINGILTFLGLVSIVSSIFIVGFMVGISAETHNTEFLGGKVQDQFWTIQDLKMEVQRCEHNAGVIDEIVLPVYVRGVRR